MPQKPYLLMTESHDFSPQSLKQLETFAVVEAADLNRAGLLAKVASAQILWVRLRHRIDAEVMAAAPNLRCIVTPTTGLNHVDLDEAGKRGITILSLKGQTEFLKRVSATAEHTIALTLALLRHLPAAFAHVRDGGWNRDPFRGGELDGKTVGLVGYGRLGRLAAAYFRPFHVNLLACDRPGVLSDKGDGVNMVSREQLLAQADIVTLHVDYSNDNHAFFNQACFSQMKHGALFINTARGELVDETALLHALQSGKLGGAALDVLADEDSSGMGKHPLVSYAASHQNLIITPHIGGCTFESMRKTESFMTAMLQDHLNWGALIS